MKKDIFICWVFILVFHLQKPPRATYQFHLSSRSQVFSECLGIAFSFFGFREILQKKHTISCFTNEAETMEL